MEQKKNRSKDLMKELIQEALKKKEARMNDFKKILPKKFYYSGKFLKVVEFLNRKGVRIHPEEVRSVARPLKNAADSRPDVKGNYDNLYMREMTRYSLLTEEEEIQIVQLLEEVEGGLIKETARHPFFFHFFYFFTRNKYKKAFRLKIKKPGFILKKYLKMKIFKALKKNQPLEFKKEFKIPRSEILRVAKRICEAGLENRKETARAIEQKIQKIEELQEKLINSNLRLVLSIAKKYARRKNNNLFDLIQEGNMGLIKAVEMFFYHKGVRFAAYAKWWIKQSIIRSLYENAHHMKIPLHFIEAIRKLEDFIYNFVQEKKEQPSFDKIIEGTGFSRKKVIRILQIVNKPLSLDTPVFYKDSFIELKDTIKDKNYTGPHAHVFSSIVNQNVQSLLSGLSDRERSILIKRYGLEDGIQRTLDEVGYYFNLTRERIRQIERKALEKLKVPSKMSFCKKLLEEDAH